MTAMDELAVKLGIDPIELRRINDTMTEPIEGKPFSSRSLMTCYDQAAETFGWLRRDPRPGSMRENEWLIGWGCATALYPTHVGPVAVRVRLLPAGDVTVQTAERLGAPLASVTVELGDSRLPPAPVAGGSNTTGALSANSPMSERPRQSRTRSITRLASASANCRSGSRT